MTASPGLPTNEFTAAHKVHKGNPGPSVVMHTFHHLPSDPFGQVSSVSFCKIQPKTLICIQGRQYPFSSTFENQGIFTQITGSLLGSS